MYKHVRRNFSPYIFLTFNQTKKRGERSQIKKNHITVVETIPESFQKQLQQVQNVTGVTVVLLHGISLCSIY